MEMHKVASSRAVQEDSGTYGVLHTWHLLPLQLRTASGFLQISPHRGDSCPWVCTRRHYQHVGFSPLRKNTHTRRTKKAAALKTAAARFSTLFILDGCQLNSISRSTSQAMVGVSLPQFSRTAGWISPNTPTSCSPSIILAQRPSMNRPSPSKAAS